MNQRRKRLIPSKNSEALIRAFDLFTPDAQSEEAYRVQSMRLSEELEEYIPIVAELLSDNEREPPRQQNQLDALLSVVYDTGSDLFLASPLPHLIRIGAKEREIRKALRELTECFGTLRSDLALEMRRYGMAVESRRKYEADLYFGRIFFAIGEQQDPSDKYKRIYKPYVIHPFFHFLSR